MKTLLRDTALMLLASVFLFFLVEGGASSYYVLRKVWRSTENRPAEQLYSRYDEQLGWVPVPNTARRDFYGPGKHVHINSIAARSETEFTREVPPGRLRLIFFGDSFTHGWGVGDSGVWNQLIARRDSRLEAVNFGQGGYGFDQAYLWGLRQEVLLDHDVHVLAFVGDAFNRARRDRFDGYPKPVLKLVDGRIEVTNTPVPRFSRVRQWWSRNRYLLRDLRILELALGLVEPPVGRTSSATPLPPSDDAFKNLVRALFADRQARCQRQGRLLLLAFLPSLWDHPEDPAADAWRSFLHDEADRLGIPLFDPTSGFRRFSRGDATKLFISAEEAPRYGGAWHYNEAGNRYIADVFYQWLMGLPEVQARLTARTTQ